MAGLLWRHLWRLCAMKKRTICPGTVLFMWCCSLGSTYSISGLVLADQWAGGWDLDIFSGIGEFWYEPAILPHTGGLNSILPLHESRFKITYTCKFSGYGRQIPMSFAQRGVIAIYIRHITPGQEGRVRWGCSHWWEEGTVCRRSAAQHTSIRDSMTQAVGNQADWALTHWDYQSSRPWNYLLQESSLGYLKLLGFQQGRLDSASARFRQVNSQTCTLLCLKGIPGSSCYVLFPRVAAPMVSFFFCTFRFASQ